jgi:hypothetical protein
MKKTYLFVITTVLTVAFSAKAQLNELNVNELAQIKFNNTSLTQIRQIAGNDQKAEALFGKGNFESMRNDYLNPNPNSTEDCPDWCMYYQLFNRQLYVRFEKESTNDDFYHFTYAKVKSSDINVTVKNVTVSIGDSIDAFKNKGYHVNEKHNWVVFVDEDTATIDIAFYFHPKSRKITKIQMTTY